MGKASRKKQEARSLSLSETIDAGPVGTVDWLNSLEAACKRETLALSRPGQASGKALGPVFEATDKLVGMVTDNVNRKFAAGKVDRRPVCRTGCDHCCHVDVGVNTGEVVAVVEHVQATFSLHEQAELLERVRQRNRAKAALPEDKRLGSPMACPFLVESKCSVYSARPLSCRILHSTDVEPCRQTREGRSVLVPVILEYSKFVTPVRTGYVRAQQQAGLQTGPLWLSEAVEVALTDETCVAAWQTGADPFAAAKQSPLKPVHTEGDSDETDEPGA